MKFCSQKRVKIIDTGCGFLNLILIISVVVLACQKSFTSKEVEKINVIYFNYLFMVKISSFG